jgi:hypothetical protein
VRERRPHVDSYVTDEIRYAPRKREGRWIVVRQVYRDGRWWSQLHRQQEASDADNALDRASTAAWAERKTREDERGD